MRARSGTWNERTERKIWTAVIVAIVLLPTCGFPDHTFFVEDCENGKDDDLDGLIDCEDSTCGAHYVCLSTVPYGWNGPVVVWQGSDIGRSSAPTCAVAGNAPDYYDALYSGYNAAVTGTEPCPECTCSTASPTNARCESSIEYFQDDNCSQPSVSPASIGTTLGTTCTQLLSADNSVRSYRVDQPNVVYDGVCAPVSSSAASLPEVVWDNMLRPCRPKTSTIGDARLSVRLPEDPFSRLVCVYKAGSPSSTCPANAYREVNFTYHEAMDQRSCSACTCQANGVSCQSSGGGDMTIADYGNSRDCSGQPQSTINAIKSNCIQIAPNTMYPLYAKLTNATTMTGGVTACTPSQSQVQGMVTVGQAVTFCCDNLQP